MTAAAEAGGSAAGGWRIVLAMALVGTLLGFGFGIADQPRWRATATVAVESDSQGSDEARLERFAQRGESEQVATAAAGMLGDDVPGADLLADISVRPAAPGGFLIVTADADAPDVAAAAADGFQRALVEVEGDPLALGKAATIPSEPYEDRSAALWAGIGFLAGLAAALAVAAAGAGRNVLLVETDLAAAALAAALGVAPSPGLVDYLGGDAAPRDVLRAVVVAPSGSAGFACVPAGVAAAGASVAGPRFEGLVGRLARVYDLVIYVAPPVLDSSDADAVTGLTEAVAVVAGPGVGADELDEAAGLLEGARVAVVAASR